ncbi:MAG: aminotransferase class IV [Ignavibacteria bacterium]|nr:aminotransferase class IV [Ignavibacteria bacterium]
MWIYINETYIERERATISPFDRGFLFSDGVYEVIRYYPESGYFQTQAHLRRLQYGLEQLQIRGIDTERISVVIEDLLRKNDQTTAQAIAYIQATRGAPYPRQHFFPPASTPPTLFITTSPFKPHTEEIERGVSVLLEKDIRWLRCDIKTIALLPNVLSRQHAVQQGACETIWSRDGFITEGTHTNFCAIKGGTLLTPPRSNLILSGTTRQVVLDICPKLNIPVQEAPIKESDISELDECLIVGTTTEITPVVRMGETTIRDGMSGAITKKLQNELYKIIFNT